MGSVVQVHSDPPEHGGLAQLGEHLLCKQGVVGSIPSSSTKFLLKGKRLCPGVSYTREFRNKSSDLFLVSYETRLFFNKMEEVKVVARKGSNNG